jgi:hypothetical protein
MYALHACDLRIRMFRVRLRASAVASARTHARSSVGRLAESVCHRLQCRAPVHLACARAFVGVFARARERARAAAMQAMARIQPVALDQDEMAAVFTLDNW